MADLLFIVNPRAGKRTIRSNVVDITDIFIKNGYTVSTYITQGSGDATRYLKRHAESYDLVICCGGDGTLNETINGIAELERPPRVGYISAGTTNDVGYSLNIPPDMLKAAETAVAGTPRAWDIGRFCGDKYFCYAAAFGMFTDVTYSTDQQAKNIWGRTAYILQGARSLSSIKCYHTKINCDGRLYEGDYMLVLISNTVSVGGFRTVFGDSPCLDDGLFEVTLVKRPKTLEELNHVASILLEIEDTSEVESKFLTFTCGNRLEIEVDTPVAWTLDGEYGGKTGEAVIENIGGLLTIMGGEVTRKKKRIPFLKRIFGKRRPKANS